MERRNKEVEFLEWVFLLIVGGSLVVYCHFNLKLELQTFAI